MNVQSKREREKETVSLMIAIYCRKKHGGKTLCPDCAALEAYARQRSDKCPFMETRGKDLICASKFANRRFLPLGNLSVRLGKSG